MQRTKIFAHGHPVLSLLGLLIYAAVIESVPTDIKPSGKPYHQFRYDIEVSRNYMTGLENYYRLLDQLGRILDRYDANGEMPLEINPGMKKNIQQFLEKTTLADRNLKILILDVDGNMEKRTERISVTENHIRHSKAQIEKAKVRIAAADKKISLANQRKKTLEANLKAHEEALRLAKERKDKARHECLSGKRRRKRGLFKKLKKIHRKIHGHHKKVHRKITNKLPGGKIDQKIHGIIETGTCEVLNVITKQIDKEKKAVDSIKKRISEENRKLESATRELNDAKSHRTRLTKELAQHTKNLEYHEGKLVQYKKERNMLIEVGERLKRTNTIISSIKSRAEVVHLNTELGFLLDVDGITIPVNEVANIILEHDSRKDRRKNYFLDVPPAKINKLKVRLAKIAAETRGR